MSVAGSQLLDSQQFLREAGALYNAGRYPEAEQVCRAMLDAQANEFGALNLLGIITARTGRTEESAQLLARAVAASPKDPGIRNNFGNVLRRLGRFDEALKQYDRALQIEPRYAEAHNNRGNALKELGRFDEALQSYERALRIKPEYPEAHYNRGVTLHEDLRLPEQALASYERALQIAPDYFDALNNRGSALRDLDRFEEALQSYERALQIKPDHVDVCSNRGLVLQSLQRLDAALASYDRALAVDPAAAGARLNRSMALLLNGDFAQGWSEYEWRWKPADRQLHQQRLGAARPWLGDASLADKTLLLIGEQGLGDTIQFCRYASVIAELGARIILAAPKPLHDILGTLAGVARVVTDDEPLPACDYYCFLLSLPLALKTTLSTIPAQVPYLSASAQKAAYWAEKLGPRSTLRVGLVWSGGFRADQPELWSVNNRRNIALTKLAPLAHPGVEFFSLQKGQPAEAELEELTARGWDGPPLRDFTGEFADFADTAALISQLDLVISVDTSTAHLAAAMGKPVWILNRFDTCWRWLLDRNDSPWYPTVRLYRQERPGDWDGVVRKIVADLEALVRTTKFQRATLDLHGGG